ncbi:MAG: peptide ABC transporter substrate-binding protein [Planctomycetota bacterium]|nr:peptide ABC transporter substrate-binding protein [Planctomycetota bacterium]
MQRGSRVVLAVMAWATLAAAEPDAWMDAVQPPGEGWRQHRQELVVNNESEPKTLDPHRMTGVVEMRVASALFEGLTTPDPRDLTPRPALAASWEVDDDGLGYTFRLRPGLAFSDGRPIDAEVVRASWLRALAPATGCEYAELFDPIVGAEALRRGAAAELGVEARDPLTLRVRLRHPCPWFLQLLAMPPFAAVPLHAIAAHGERWTAPGALVSSGPFLLAEHRPRQHLVLVPNPRWRAAPRLRLTRLTLLPIADADAAYRLFCSGAVHWLPSIPLAKWEEVRWLPEYYIAPFLASYFYRFNCARPPFADKRVRRAFSLAIDRRVIARQVLRAGQVPATWLTPPMPGYEPPRGLATDRARARALLAEAGWGPGGRPLPRIRLLYNTSEAHKQIAEAVAKQWEEALGVQVELVNREWKVYLAELSALDYMVARSAWVADYQHPDTFLSLWVGNGGNNRTGWASADYDAALQAARAERDPRAQMQRYRELERVLVEDELPIMPLYIYVSQGLLRSEVRGWWTNPRDEHPWWCLWIEP